MKDNKRWWGGKEEGHPWMLLAGTEVSEDSHHGKHTIGSNHLHTGRMPKANGAILCRRCSGQHRAQEPRSQGTTCVHSRQGDT